MSIVSLHSVLLVVAVTHLVMASVMALFARHKIQYLSIASVVGIFGAAVACVIPFAAVIETTRPAMLHPGTLMGLMAFTFLQSIYPLGVSMPGYLQWKRMWKYALPVIILTILYLFFTKIGVTSPNYYTWKELGDAFFTLDMLLRAAMLGVSVYYVVNILRLPRTMLRQPHVPGYLRVYTTFLGFISCLYLWVILKFTVPLFEVWVILFTCANVYMCMRALETLALSLPQPAIKTVEEAPDFDATVAIEEDKEEDFNEANLRRFECLEYWMQHHRDDWKDYTFGRDQLCAGAGINRHLALQCVRSQGYNNIHEYINAYRVAELQRMISYGEILGIRDCLDAGFGTLKTARSNFERVTGKTLDEVLANKLDT